MSGNSEKISWAVLRGTRWTIGRSNHCDFRIEDGRVSRRQAAIEFRAGDWAIVGNADAVPAYLNGRLIEGRAPFSHGALIEFGATRMTVLLEEDRCV